jgi:hypothetical protein
MYIPHFGGVFFLEARMIKNILKEVKDWIITLCVVLSVVMIITTIHVAFNGGVNKSFMNTYTLTNGDKTVVYQSMSHIGLKSFYKSVQNDIADYRNKGYDIFFEGFGYDNSTILKKGDEGYEAAVTVFNKVKVLQISYLSKYAVEASPYTLQIESYDFINSQEYGDKIADFSSTEYYASINKYFKVDKNEPEFSSRKQHPNDPLPALSMMASNSNTDFLAFLTEYPKTAIYIMNLNNFFVFDFFRDYVDPYTKHFIDSLKFHTDVLINSRNINLVKNILENENKNIYITYGSDHFRGVLKELQLHDPNWKIMNVSKKIVVSN